MRILCLDQSLERTGWALWGGGHAFRSGSWPLAPNLELRAPAYRELWGKVDQIHAEHPLDLIVHEKPVFGAANKGELQLLAACGMVAVLELLAVSRSIPICSYAVQSWRTSWFSKLERKAISAKPDKLRDWKGPAIARARQLGFDPVSHDEAEAIGILDHHMLLAGIVPEWRAGQLQLEPIA